MFSKEKQLWVNKKKKNRNFSKNTIMDIFERDQYRCVRCKSYRIESVPHHIIFKSQLGDGTKRNGATVCPKCHREAHTYRKVRKWFEDWKTNNLDEEGNLVSIIDRKTEKKGIM